MIYDFNGEKYKEASKHQKEWGNKIISELSLKGCESILDLGCGDGALTLQLARLVPDGKVVGLDASNSMIETAKQKNSPNLTFVCADMDAMDFLYEFDLIFSNAALHWVKNHRRLLDNCAKALKPGGSLRWSFGGFGNCANLIETLRISIDMPEYKDVFHGFEWPWYLPNVEEYSKLVAAAGYSEYNIFLENAERYFADSEEIIKWIEQPCLVPFLAYIDDKKTKSGFRNTIINAMLKKTKCRDGTYFETFRRINIIAFYLK